MTIIEMRVYMNSSRCESRVKKALGKLEGINGMEIDMNLQKVTLSGNVDQGEVLGTVRKTGLKAELWISLVNPYNSFNETVDHSGSQRYSPSYNCYEDEYGWQEERISEEEFKSDNATITDQERKLKELELARELESKEEERKSKEEESIRELQRKMDEECKLLMEEENLREQQRKMDEEREEECIREMQREMDEKRKAMEEYYIRELERRKIDEERESTEEESNGELHHKKDEERLVEESAEI